MVSLENLTFNPFNEWMRSVTVFTKEVLFFRDDNTRFLLVSTNNVLDSFFNYINHLSDLVHNLISDGDLSLIRSNDWDGVVSWLEVVVHVQFYGKERLESMDLSGIVVMVSILRTDRLIIMVSLLELGLENLVLPEIRFQDTTFTT